MSEKFAEAKITELTVPLINEKKFIHNDAIEAAGEFGNYQKQSLILLSLVWFIVPSIPVLIPMFRMVPPEICDNTNENCTPEYYCSLPDDSSLHFHNWLTDFKGLGCNTNVYGYVATLYFIGILIGFMFISEFSDRYGRKPVLTILLYFYLGVTSILLIFPSITALCIALFIIGICYSGASMCSFVLSFESTNQKNQTFLTTLVSMSFGIGALINITLFYIFEDWKTIVLISGLICIGLIFAVNTIKESPEFLLARNKYSELKEVLTYIAERNSRVESLNAYFNTVNFNKIQTIVPTNRKIYSSYEILKNSDSKLLIKIFIICFNWFVATLTFYGINFNLDNFRLNVYLIGFIVYISEVISQFSSMFLINAIGDKNSIIFYYSLTGVALLILYFIPFNGFISQSITMVLIFIGKFGIAAINNVNYIHSARLFNVSIRMGSMSLFKLISRFGGILSTVLLVITPLAVQIFGISCFMVVGLFIILDKVIEGESNINES